MGITTAETWIIDDGPLNDLAEVVDPSALAAWPRDTFFVAESTVRAAKDKRKVLLEAVASPFKRFAVMVDTRAFEILFGHLRQSSASDKNLAEHESIAWALDQCPGAVLVAQDKGAAFLALAELGRGGAAHPTELWLLLRQMSLISDEQFDQLCERTRKSDQTRTPIRCLVRGASQ